MWSRRRVGWWGRLRDLQRLAHFVLILMFELGFDKGGGRRKKGGWEKGGSKYLQELRKLLRMRAGYVLGCFDEQTRWYCLVMQRSRSVVI